MYDQKLQKKISHVLFVWRFWKIPSLFLAVTRSVMIAWTLVKISLGLQHALYVGLVLVFMRSEELEMFKDRFSKVVDPVLGVIDSFPCPN